MRAWHYQKMLNVIEKLCYCYENGNKKDLKNTQKIIDNIYKISHLAGNCKNPHKNWLKEFYKLENELKDI